MKDNILLRALIFKKHKDTYNPEEQEIIRESILKDAEEILNKYI